MTALSRDQPYPGLRPFDTGDEEFFFGRDAQTRGLLEKLRASRLVAVVGRSGCGKSSLVKAGLMPLLRAGTRAVWYIASFRPRGQPIAELTKELERLTAELQPTASDGASMEVAGSETEEDKLAAAKQPVLTAKAVTELRRGRLDAILRRSSQGLIEIADELDLTDRARLLIIVDQFEEIFRFEDPTGRNTDEATAFVRLLMEAINARESGIDVILTMRLDFLGDCARFARLPEAISDGQYLVPNLSRAERRAAIEGPAKKCGKPIRPEVTQRLLNEIGEDPDQLPVLQHILMRMWQKAEHKSEITLAEYEATGGVKNAISQHADQVYDRLKTDADRLIAEHMFKAISERDLRGRFIRRIALLQDVQAIVAPTAPSMKDESFEKLKDVVEAFRSTDCCFLMPAVGEELLPQTAIDISHESLLRGWTRMVGKQDQEGWIVQEDRNGRTYRTILDLAENDNPISPQQQKWWNSTRPTEGWAKRYGGKFADVEKFVQASNRKAAQWRWVVIATSAIAATLAVALVTTLVYLSYVTVQRRAERAESDRLNDAYNKAAEEQRVQLNLLRAQQANAQKELATRDSELKALIERFQKTVPQDDRNVRNELEQIRQASENVAQVAPIGQKDDASLLSTDIGFMWIGSARGGSNLNTLNGAPLASNAVEVNGQYLTNLDIYLREGLPDRTSYAQAKPLGIMPDGTRVQLLSIEPPYTRPTGEQYWAKARVVKLALSTVYFQFAGGSRDQAQQLSKILQDTGYRIPGEERTSAAANQHEVRYFYTNQRPIADKLASDTNSALQRLAYSPLNVRPVQVGSPTKSNPDGKLELRLEIPPR